MVSEEPLQNIQYEQTIIQPSSTNQNLPNFCISRLAEWANFRRIALIKQQQKNTECFIICIMADMIEYYN